MVRKTHHTKGCAAFESFPSNEFWESIARMPFCAILWRSPKNRQIHDKLGAHMGFIIIDLLKGLFRGAVFRQGGGARKQPIKQSTEMPTSTMTLLGRFPCLMGRFWALMGRFPDLILRGRFTSSKSNGKQPVKKRGIKRFLKKGSEKRSETCPKHFKPLSRRFKISRRHFSKSFSPPEISTISFLSARGSAGVATLRNVLHMSYKLWF